MDGVRESVVVFERGFIVGSEGTFAGELTCTLCFSDDIFSFVGMHPAFIDVIVSNCSFIGAMALCVVAGGLEVLARLSVCNKYIDDLH